jgi:uncharacterized protein (DUF885 family)
MTNARFVVGALLLLSPVLTLAQQPARPAVNATAEDLHLRAIYNAEDAWRKAQRGAEDEDHPDAILAQLPLVGAAKQQADLEHWQGVLRQVDALHPAQLSPDERVNYQVFRAQIVVLINQQKFREYERPVNSDTTFWSDEEETGRQTFRTQQDYVHYLSQLKDLPRYFRENIANMRAGLARGFTPPKVTLTGRDQSLLPVADTTSALRRCPRPSLQPIKRSCAPKPSAPSRLASSLPTASC